MPPPTRTAAPTVGCYRSLDHRRRQTLAPILPVEIGRLADPGTPADLCNRPPFHAPLQYERLLRIRKFQRLHLLPFLPAPGKYPENPDSKMVQLSGGRSDFFCFYDKALLAYLMGQWLKVETAPIGTSSYVRDNIPGPLLAASHCEFI